MKNLNIKNIDYEAKLKLVKYSIAPTMTAIGFGTYYLESNNLKVSLLMSSAYFLTGLVGYKATDIKIKSLKK